MRPARSLALLLALAACPGRDTDTSDTSDTGDTEDTDDTDSGDTDSGDTDSGDTSDTDDSGGPSNWDFEDWTTSDPPPGFTKAPASDWTVTEGTDAVEGAASAEIVLLATGPTRRLQAEVGAAVPASATYRFHAWLHDDDPDVAARLEVQAYTAGNIGPVTQATDATTDGAGWVEHALEVQTTTADTLRPRLRIEEVTGLVGGSTVRTDAWAITRPHTFAPTDGVDDAVAVPIAGTPGTTMDVSAALSSDGILYVTTNQAEFGSDHLLFLWIGPPHATEQVAPPWNKGGLVAGPSVGGHLVVLVQEEGLGKFCEWLVWNDTHWAVPADDACSAASGTRLEGTLPLYAALGLPAPTALPRVLYVSVSPWETGTAADGELKAPFQVPAGNGDALLDADEVLSFSRVPLLVGHLDETP